MNTIDFATVKDLYAKKSNQPVSDASKKLRARLRSNFDTLAKADPSHYGAKGTIKERANDQRPWGPIPATFARDVLGIEVKAPRAKKSPAKKNITRSLAPIVGDVA